MASSMTDFALAYPDITVGMASRRNSTTTTPFGSRSGTPRTSMDVDRKLKDKGKGKEKDNESFAKSKSKKDKSKKSGGDVDEIVRPSPAAQAMGNWFMLK